MGEVVRRTVVVSAVNIRKGGTLTILRDCLSYLSSLSGQYRIVALVHDRSLCDYPGIDYIELPWCTKSWGLRLWAEYVTMHKISLSLEKEDGRPVWTWLSLHDSTPRVKAEHREVYCHTAFPFMKIKAQDFIMDPKIALFALFTRWTYRINVHANESIIVQQNWFADAMSRMLGVERGKFRVIPPSSAAAAAKYSPAAASEASSPGSSVPASEASAYGSSVPASGTSVSGEPVSSSGGPAQARGDVPTFLYVSTADAHKNFETLCRAAEMVENQLGSGRFRLLLTVKGDENRYARWLYRHWGHCGSIDFHGLMAKEELFRNYASCDCFIFPSRVESWGLPISEFKAVQPSGTMILADLPYAHETSAGFAGRLEFFPVSDYKKLAESMMELID